MLCGMVCIAWCVEWCVCVDGQGGGVGMEWGRVKLGLNQTGEVGETVSCYKSPSRENDTTVASQTGCKIPGRRIAPRTAHRPQAGYMLSQTSHGIPDRLRDRYGAHLTQSCRRCYVTHARVPRLVGRL